METAVKEKVYDLESILGDFIAHTDSSLSRLEENISSLSKELREQNSNFKEEMAEQSRNFKEEMAEQRRNFKEEMAERDRNFKEMMEERDLKAREDMDQFKNEMRTFKDEMQSDRKKMNKQWGDLANKMGTIVEDIVAPGLGGIAREYFQIDAFDNFSIRNYKKSSSGDVRREFDVVAYTAEYLFIVETKSSPRIDTINEFIRLIPSLSNWFPEFSEKAIIPIFASLYIKPEHVKYLSKHNVLAMAMKDDNMDLLNPEVRYFWFDKTVENSREL